MVVKMEIVKKHDIHEHLKKLVHGCPERWTYAILWRRFLEPQEVLRFEEGYYRSMGEEKEIRILGSSVTVREELMDADSEWFFKISMAQSFIIHHDLPGLAFWSGYPVWINATDLPGSSTTGERSEWDRWERSKWGHQFGIQTFLCLRLNGGRVLELASTRIIPIDNLWTEKMADFIHPIGTPSYRLYYRMYDHGEGRTDIQKQNHRNNNVSKPSRGKEKISSICSWSLLTQSSERFSCSHDFSGPS